MKGKYETKQARTPIKDAKLVLVKKEPIKKLNIIAEKANEDNETNMRPKFVSGKIEPYFSIKLTTNAIMTMAKYVVMNHASQLIPGRKPIAFIV